MKIDKEKSELKRELEQCKKIIKDTLYVLPVGNINTHTPDTIPERVQDWIKEAAEECRLREKWEECADRLIEYAHEFVAQLSAWGNGYDRNDKQIKAAEDAIELYNKLKNN